MVSNNGPPFPMPMQVPPGHLVQQIVDEEGILTHVILSSYRSSSQSTLSPTISGQSSDQNGTGNTVLGSVQNLQTSQFLLPNQHLVNDTLTSTINFGQIYPQLHYSHVPRSHFNHAFQSNYFPLFHSYITPYPSYLNPHLLHSSVPNHQHNYPFFHQYQMPFVPSYMCTTTASSYSNSSINVGRYPLSSDMTDKRPNNVNLFKDSMETDNFVSSDTTNTVTSKYETTLNSHVTKNIIKETNVNNTETVDDEKNVDSNYLFSNFLPSIQVEISESNTKVSY